jgi:hypothetical protein
MLLLDIIGKATPVILKRVRFKASSVEGISIDGVEVTVRYEQIKDMHNTETALT